MSDPIEIKADDVYKAVRIIAKAMKDNGITVGAACIAGGLYAVDAAPSDGMIMTVQKAMLDHREKVMIASSKAAEPPLLPITPGWYKTRGGDKLQVIEVRTVDCLYPVVVRFDKSLVGSYHADGKMCHDYGEQACDLIKRTTAPEGGGS